MKLIFSVLIFVGLIGCNSNKIKQDEPDSPKNGTIQISVDETFKPVIEEELKVYHSAFPQSNIIVHYKSEADCFRDLQSDSTRLIIVARGLTKTEYKSFESVLSFQPSFDAVAYDAVALITNINNSDSVYTLNKIKNILLGNNPIVAVMDGKNATSTVRYLQDSILANKPFGTNVVAAHGSQAVIDYVAKNRDAIGFV